MDKIIERFSKLDTTCVSDAMDKLGIECCAYGIKPLQTGSRICGRAFTVHYTPCGAVNGTVGDFLDDVEPGNVVVIDNVGRDNCTVWGDIMSKAAKQFGVAGTVINGVCRDVPAIIECKYPVFSKGYYVRTGKDRVYVDSINKPVMLADIPVYPGDIVIGDDTGVVVVPQSQAEKIVEVAENIDAKEQKINELIKTGCSLKEAREKTGYHHLQTKESKTLDYMRREK